MVAMRSVCLLISMEPILITNTACICVLNNLESFSLKYIIAKVIKNNNNKVGWSIS